MNARLKAIDGGRAMDAASVRRRELAQIHMAASALGLDDEHYRHLLFAIARVRSAADLDWTGRKRVLDHFRKLGWRPQRKFGAGDRQVALIRSLWHQLHEAGAVRNDDGAALAAYVHRMTGRDALQWLSTGEARTVIEAMKQWLARYRAPEATA